MCESQYPPSYVPADTRGANNTVINNLRGAALTKPHAHRVEVLHILRASAILEEVTQPVGQLVPTKHLLALRVCLVNKT